MKLKRKLAAPIFVLLAAIAVTTTGLTTATEKPASAFQVLDVGQASGFTMHANWDLFGQLHLGWTIHPQTVKAINNAMQRVKGASQVVLNATAIAVCKKYVGGLAVVCGAAVTAFTNFLFKTFHDAAAFGVCVTIKAKVGLFTVFSPAHPFWDSFPYVDSGKWCNYKHYYSPAKPPTYTGPVLPPKGSCTPYPECSKV